MATVTTDKSGVLKMALGILGSCLVTVVLAMGSFWVTWGKTAVSHAEAKSMIEASEKRSSKVQELQIEVVLAEVRGIRRSLDELKADVKEMNSQ